MTNTAVANKKADIDKELGKLELELKKQIETKKLDIDADKLVEAARHNKQQEYLDKVKIQDARTLAIADSIRNLFNPAAMLLGGKNDESWHNKLTYAYEQATNLPFSEKAGNPNFIYKAGINLSFRARSPFGPKLKNEFNFNSGIIEVKYVPTIGTSDQQVESSELQNNVRLLFTPVRQANSGAVNNYDQSDLFQFTMASSSAFEILRLVARPLNYINARRKQNNVLSAWDKHVLTVMTGSVNNANYMINFKTDIIQSINSMIRTYNSQVLPIGFDLTRRRSLLNGRIFTHDGDRDEMYIFNPTTYYVYDEANAKLTAKQLNLVTFFSSVDNMKAVLIEMLSPLVNGTTTSIMAGDMKKAFPKQVNAIRELPYQFKGDIYSNDEHILEALRNASVHPWISGYGSVFDIKQGVNSTMDTYIYQGKLNLNNVAYIASGPVSSQEVENYLVNTQSATGGYDGFYKFNRLLDVKVDSPTRYDIMAGTRFQTTDILQLYRNSAGDYEREVTIRQWGTEIIQNVSIYAFSTESEFSLNTLHKFDLNMDNALVFYDGGLSTITMLSQAYSRFHYLPQMYNVMTSLHDDDYGTTDIYSLINYTHSNYNMRLMTSTELGHLHTASFGSLVSIESTKSDELE